MLAEMIISGASVRKTAPSSRRDVVKGYGWGPGSGHGASDGNSRGRGAGCGGRGPYERWGAGYGFGIGTGSGFDIDIDIWGSSACADSSGISAGGGGDIPGTGFCSPQMRINYDVGDAF